MEHLKKQAALAALDYIKVGDVVGVGTGSTVNYFIDNLATIKNRLDGAVASSLATEYKLKAIGIKVLDLNQTGALPLYIDGADESDRHLRLIKGGKGALTREKIIAQASRRFICIVDQSKVKDRLGTFPLPIEVIPCARSLVAREIIGYGGIPKWREGVETDNGNAIIDVINLDLSNPVEMEERINNIVGVVAVGLFAKRGADELIIAKTDCLDIIKKT